MPAVDVIIVLIKHNILCIYNNIMVTYWVSIY